MRLYSDFFRPRALQALGDVLALIFLIGGLVAASLAHAAINAFDEIGEGVQASGAGLADTMTDIGDNLAGVPFIGTSIQSPFDDAADAGTALAGAGRQWQDGVHSLANAVGFTIAALVVLLVAVAWVLPRLRGVARRREAARLAASPASLDLLALRALTTGAPRDVTGITADVVGSWRRGDHDVIRQLAALELRSRGIRLKPVG